MVFPQFGELLWLERIGGHSRAAQGRGQIVQRRIHMVGESIELGAGGGGTAAEQAGFERHHGMNEAVRIGEHGVQRRGEE